MLDPRVYGPGSLPPSTINHSHGGMNSMYYIEAERRRERRYREEMAEEEERFDRWWKRERERRKRRERAEPGLTSSSTLSSLTLSPLAPCALRLAPCASLPALKLALTGSEETRHKGE